MARRLAYPVARRLFPPGAPRSRPLRQVVHRRTIRALAGALELTPMAGKLWLMGGLAIGYARDGRPLANDLVDVDLGYADEDHEVMMEIIEVLKQRAFAEVFRLSSNAGVQTATRLRREGVWVDLVRCFRRADREYWITYLTDRHSPLAPREVEVETEVRFQEKVRTVFPLYGTTWLQAAELPRYLTEQYGEAWMAPEEIFYGRDWDHVRDSPAVVRCDPWSGSWERSFRGAAQRTTRWRRRDDSTRRGCHLLSFGAELPHPRHLGGPCRRVRHLGRRRVPP